MPAHDGTNIATAIVRGTLDPCLPSGTLELVHGVHAVADGETALSAGVARQVIVDSIGLDRCARGAADTTMTSITPSHPALFGYDSSELANRAIEAGRC